MSRFAQPQDDAFRRMNDSISFDWRLWPYDVEQSVAHATMLAAQGIISTSDRDALHRGLERVRSELTDGTFPFAERDEDIHMAVERRVTEIVGEVGGRLHTARSRNDQVATDMAMFVRDHARQAVGSIAALVPRCSTPPMRTSTGRCRATRTFSGRSPCTCHTTCSPTRGCCSATGIGFLALPTRPPCCRSAPARWRVSTSTPTADSWPAVGFCRCRRQLDRRGLEP